MTTAIPYFDIFISYTAKSPTSNQSQIQKLYRRLTEDYGFKVWLGKCLSGFSEFLLLYEF